MCILCVGARCSRRIFAMLPWLIIPFIFVWAFSQFLSPGYRLEITSPRLACVGVLLCSLCWYELIKPRLTEWREKRAVLLRERQRIEAQKAARWRKEATKHCRNCHSPYKDQHPQATGKYMCTYCGHASKKPELHIPGEPRPSGRSCDFLKLESCWSSSTCWKILLEELDKQKFFHLVLKILSYLKNVLRHESSSDGYKRRQFSSSRVDDPQERRERAKRKAEERKLARLEREKKEEEERREREEFKKLVDERSRMRAELLKAEKEAAAERERELTRKKEKEAEKKKQVKPKIKEKDSVNEAIKVNPELKSPEISKNKSRSYYTDYRNFRAGLSSTWKASFSSTWKSKTSSVSTPSRNTVESVKWNSPIREANPPGTRLSWSKVLRGITNTETTTNDVVSSPTKETASPEHDPVPKWKQEDRPPLSSPVSADPIYLPGNAPAQVLPPISAPHNTLTSNTSSLFSPFFPSTTVLPQVTPDQVTTASTPSSPNVQSNIPPNAPPYPAPNSYDWPVWQEEARSSPCRNQRDTCLEDDYEVPHEFIDCFTRDIMVDPVTLADGHSYDRSTIETWLLDHNTSPMTGNELPPPPPPDSVDRSLRPNHVLRSQIIQYNERKKASRDAIAMNGVSPWPVTSGRIPGFSSMWSYEHTTNGHGYANAFTC